MQREKGKREKRGVEEGEKGDEGKEGNAKGRWGKEDKGGKEVEKRVGGGNVKNAE